MDARKSRFAPNTPDPVCVKGTRHLIRFARNAFKDLLTPDIGYLSSLGSSFVIEIQAHARQIGLERICWNKTKIKQICYCSCLYICHTKAMTTLVEYGTRCFYKNTNFHSVLIVRSASWLKLKSSHFRKCCEDNFCLCVRLMQNHMEIFLNTAKLFLWRLRLNAESTVTPLLTNGW